MKDCKCCKFFCDKLYKEVLERLEEKKDSSSTGCCFQQTVNLDSNNKEECFYFIKRPNEWSIDSSILALSKKKKTAKKKEVVENKEKDNDNRTNKRISSSSKAKQSNEKSEKKSSTKAKQDSKTLNLKNAKHKDMIK